MGKTKRNILNFNSDDGNYMENVDDTQAKHRKSNVRNHKMKPYTKGFKFKERAVDSDTGNKRPSKLERDRINRSYKKGKRQELKKQILKEFNEDI